jgi:hypothetical protein
VAKYYMHKDAAGTEYKACTLDCNTIANWQVDGKQVGGFATTKAGTDYIRRGIDPVTKEWIAATAVGDPWCEKCP